MNWGWIQAGQKSEVSNHHEPLDVVGVGFLKGLSDAVLQATHVGFSGPKPAWQG